MNRQLSPMPNQQNEDTPEELRTDGLKLLVKFIEFLKVKGETQISTLFLMQERLIYTAAHLLDKGVQIEKIPFDFTSEVIQFVQKVNLKCMEAGNKSSFEELILQISRAIDMVLYKPVYQFIQPSTKVLDLRILTFNNLSCIYRQNKQYQDALKAVDKAIQMEEILVQEKVGENCKNIASTYINKAVILSELNLHLESIETMKKSLDSMENYRQNYEEKLTDSDIFELKYLSQQIQKAVEHEHLNYQQYARTFYEIALNISRELKYVDMIKTIENVLKKIQKQQH